MQNNTLFATSTSYSTIQLHIVYRYLEWEFKSMCAHPSNSERKMEIGQRLKNIGIKDYDYCSIL